MKTTMVLAVALMLLVLSAVPALAQSAPTDGATGQYNPETGTVTLDFELAVQGTPPTGTGFFGFIPAEGGISAPLTDPDGDGLYTGSMTVSKYGPGPTPVPEGTEPVTLPVQIVTSSEAKHSVPLSPDLIEGFGQVLMDEDKTFSSAIVFDGPAGPGEPVPPTPGPKTPEPDDPEPGINNVTLSFELAIQGTPPADKSFFGFIPAEGGIATQLTDPDGDGLYTGSMDVPQYAPGLRPVPEGTEPVTFPIQIVMSSEVRHGVPLYPNSIEDFGQVLMDEDKTFSTSIAFESPGPGEPEPTTPEPTTPEPTTPEPTTPEPTTPEPTTPEPTTPEPTTPDSGGGESPTILDDIDVLPDTGGAAFWALGAGALLIGAGLSAWRLKRR